MAPSEGPWKSKQPSFSQGKTRVSSVLSVRLEIVQRVVVIWLWPPKRGWGFPEGTQLSSLVLLLSHTSPWFSSHIPFNRPFIPTRISIDDKSPHIYTPRLRGDDMGNSHPMMIAMAE